MMVTVLSFFFFAVDKIIIHLVLQPTERKNAAPERCEFRVDLNGK